MVSFVFVRGAGTDYRKSGYNLQEVARWWKNEYTKTKAKKIIADGNFKAMVKVMW